MEAIVVIVHGSKSDKAKAEFEAIVKMVQEKTEAVVKGACLEPHTPSISETIETLILENPELKKIKAVPLFLFEGVHIKKDIPEILERKKEKYPEIEFKFAKPIGAEPLLADILIKRVGELF